MKKDVSPTFKLFLIIATILSLLLLVLTYFGINNCDGFGCFGPGLIGISWLVFVAILDSYLFFYSTKKDVYNNRYIIFLYLIGFGIFLYWALFNGSLAQDFWKNGLFIAGILISLFPLGILIP